MSWFFFVIREVRARFLGILVRKVGFFVLIRVLELGKGKIVII